MIRHVWSHIHACLQVLELDFHFWKSISVVLLSLQTRTASKCKRIKSRFWSANLNFKSIKLTRIASDCRILFAYNTPKVITIQKDACDITSSSNVSKILLIYHEHWKQLCSPKLCASPRNPQVTSIQKLFSFYYDNFMNQYWYTTTLASWLFSWTTTFLNYALRSNC